MARRASGPRTLAVAALGAALATVAAAQGSWEIRSEDGRSSVKLGFLAVMRADSEELADGEDAQNLYFRRLRLILGGRLAEKWSYFIDTDSPNLGKSDAAGVKNSGDIFIHDFVVTYEQSPAFKVDFGMILVPLSRNTTQGAATHLASDYGPYSLLHSNATQSRVGRDYGVQLRGAVAGGRLEYRGGVYDGARGTDATEELRFAGRLAYNFFDPDTGYLYTGNNLGARRMLTFGVGFDRQDDYQALGADAFWDQPVGSDGSAFTLQGDYLRYDGGDTFATLPEQETWLAEVGYLFGALRWQPFVQWAARDLDDAALADETQTWLGVNYRMAGHERVARFAWGRISTDGAPDRDVLQLTLQLYHF